ncbi:ATP-binding protein [Pseudoalteromonas sp. MMG024]|uniref:ATP-binding protein n=1 Tax=Pseudoalteromonas sp. MMG024 TaxID=2909980 RepID=UPI001F2A4E59|nr:ATP-binding protein [Pseudoalteromonas sp. MMG024]MCF6458736.1 ATP-binding protein [Pseudoalteromonas sp. MMG024]
MSQNSFNGIPEAVYGDPGLEEYRNNPLVSCLPPLYSVKEVIAKLRDKPRFDATEIQLDGRTRVHAIARILRSFFQPLNHHLELEIKISLMLRQGYLGRNPADGSYYSHLQNGFQRVMEENLEARAFADVDSTATSLSLFGCSGCGKTEALKRVLRMYRQAIYHPEYNITQLTYLRIDCPGDGDLVELCLSFFSAVDKVLGTRYSVTHGKKKLGPTRLMGHMSQVANIHALGVLIIDEVQNLNEARSGGAEKMHNFFVSLVNTIGVPVIQVGTHRASKFFKGTFRNARRISGFGSLLWDRLPMDPQWRVLLEKLWQYQWLERGEPITEELEETMYDLTQGVMDIVIKLFVLAQVRAIVTGAERITPKLLLRVYKDELKPVHPMLAALRSGRPELIEKYDDLMMPEIEARMLSMVASLEEVIEQKQPPVRGSDKVKKLLALMEQMDIPQDIAIPMVDRVVTDHPELPISALVHKVTEYQVPKAPMENKPKRMKRSEWVNLPQGDVRRVYVEAEQENVYEAFKKQGLIFDLKALYAKAN